MDIEPPIKPATDSDDNKSNDSTASQPQHLQEMAKSTVLKDTAAPVLANDNASLEAPTQTSVAQLASLTVPQPMDICSPESKTIELSSVAHPAPNAPGMHAIPPASSQIPPTASVPGPAPHSQESPIPPPNVSVPHLQGAPAIPGAPHMQPHGAYPGYPQGPPRAPFYGHMPPYQQGFQQYSYGHHMQPYQQNYHAPPHGYPVPGHPPGAENHNPYPIQGPPMHAPIPHPSLPPPASVAAPPTSAPPANPEEAAEKNGS